MTATFCTTDQNNGQQSLYHGRHGISCLSLVVTASKQHLRKIVHNIVVSSILLSLSLPPLQGYQFSHWLRVSSLHLQLVSDRTVSTSTCCWSTVLFTSWGPASAQEICSDLLPVYRSKIIMCYREAHQGIWHNNKLTQVDLHHDAQSLI